MNQAKKITYIRAKSLAGEGSLCLLFIKQRADTDLDRRHRRARQHAERDASLLLAEAQQQRTHQAGLRGRWQRRRPAK